MTRSTDSHRTGREKQRPDAGIALIYVAVFLLSSLWFVSLAIDMGKLMDTKTQLQNAADAAALAGASAVDPNTGILQQDVARSRAATAAERNRAYEQTLTPVTINPTTDVDFPPAPIAGASRVRVFVHREAATGNPMITHFAQTIGLLSLDVRAQATAEARALNSVCKGLMPFAPQERPGNQPFSTDCDSLYVLKQSAGAGIMGNYQLLRFPPCPQDSLPGSGSGGSAIRYYTEHGYSCCAKIGDVMEVQTKTGNTVGPLRQGLLARWDADTDQRSGICFDDYKGSGERVVIVPIIQSFVVTGTSWVKIDGFAAFFLTDRPANSGQVNITGQFIKYVAPGDFGTGPPVNSGVYGIHLVE